MKSICMKNDCDQRLYIIFDNDEYNESVGTTKDIILVY